MSDLALPDARAQPPRAGLLGTWLASAIRAVCQGRQPPASQPHGEKRRSPFDHGRRDNFVADPLTVLSIAALRDLIERLERLSQDLRTRTERRAAMLETPRGAPQSDPLYQRLFFTHLGLRREIESARRELSQRTDA